MTPYRSKSFERLHPSNCLKLSKLDLKAEESFERITAIIQKATMLNPVTIVAIIGNITLIVSINFSSSYA